MKQIGYTRRELLIGAAASGLLMGSHTAAHAEPERAPLRFGIVDWDLGAPNDPDAVQKAAKLGFDGIQVDLGDVVAMKDPARQKRYMELAAQHHIAIASLAVGGALCGAPFATDNKAEQTVRDSIDIAKAMKQKVLLLAFFGDNSMSNPANTIEGVAARLIKLAPYAEKAGVTLGIEAEMSAAQYRNLLERVRSPRVQAYFDMVHAHELKADIYAEITSLKGRVCEFHAKDYGNILFGKGDVDFSAVKRALQAIGYHGWIMLEQWGEIQGDKPLGFEQTERTNLRYLREMFTKR